MKFQAIIAMLIVALQCVNYGSGFTTQSIFSEQFAWIWFVFAFYWGVAAFDAYFYLKEI